MKTGILTTKTIASDDIKDTKSIMGMSTKGMDIATFYLRDKIYSDKILAVVREYISNAWDEHNKFNIDKPVEVKLTFNNDRFLWSVRDYAMGLNEYDIRNVFGMYFESTKSNENNSIGGFGIGGKAGFSYTDTFYVTSHHNGVKTNYVCTLGAGTKGIPVGEIYKISEEPTSEQGIEISLEPKSYSDANLFLTKTENFVKFFDPSANIIFINDNSIITPEPPILSEKHEDYVFNQYIDSPHYSGSQKYFIRMGGVVYPYKRVTHNLDSYSFINCLVVDVPIGSFTIPISRESIENTPLNEKTFEDIDNHINDILKNERNSLVVPKFGALATANSKKTNEYFGQWFRHCFRESFPTTSKFLILTGRKKNTIDGTYESVSNPNLSKHIIYVIPNIKSTNNWHKRLINALQKVQGSDYNGYVYISKKDYENLLTSIDNTIDISDCSFVDVKTLKLPKLEKSGDNTESYLVYDTYGSKKYYTANELDDYVISKYFNDEELDDDWYLNVDSLEILNRRTVARVSEYGVRSCFWSVNSNKMYDALKDLGWLTPDSSEYQDMKKKFDEKSKLERLRNNVEYSLDNIYFGAKPRKHIIEIVKNKPERVHRLEKVKSLILRENTTRSRILKTLSTYNQSIVREDLRKILMMKY